MIPEPKFKLGDHVEVEFGGTIEGMTCKVRKPLVVVGIAIQALGEWAPYYLKIVYTLKEKFPTEKERSGKEYNIVEAQLIPIEPLINEMKKVKP